MGGRVLMIAHHFPPTGGSGANRALGFARYLPASGWQPTVLTPGAEWAMNRDDALLREVPESVRIVRTRSLEPRPRRVSTSTKAPSPTSRSSSKLRANLGHLKRFPDAHIGWLPFALAAAQRERCDLAYSSSGPFTSHVVGLLLKRLKRTPWVAELRDGWYRWNRAIFPDYPAWRDALERRLEAAAIRTADRVVLVTDRMADTFRAQYPDLPPERFEVVWNGFDPLQFDQSAPAQQNDGWPIVHAGALYYGRSVAAFLEAVACLVQTDAEFARDFRLRLVGTLDSAARSEVEQAGLARHLELEGQITHASAIAAMRGAGALLLVANTTPGAEATVPGKVFEYLAVGRPILAVAPTDSSTADVLATTGGGWLAPPGDPHEMACVLRRAYRERASPPAPTNIQRFDRRTLARDLARIFDQLASNARRA